MSLESDHPVFQRRFVWRLLRHPFPNTALMILALCLIAFVTSSPRSSFSASDTPDSSTVYNIKWIAQFESQLGHERDNLFQRSDRYAVARLAVSIENTDEAVVRDLRIIVHCDAGYWPRAIWGDESIRVEGDGSSKSLSQNDLVFFNDRKQSIELVVARILPSESTWFGLTLRSDSFESFHVAPTIQIIRDDRLIATIKGDDFR